MKVLVVGPGGREHALAWAIARSPGVRRVYAAPGNPGTRAVAQNVPLDPSDFDGVFRLCREAGIDLVVVGPENPLAGGIADFLRERGVAVFGPGKAGAKLESSKVWAKGFMARHRVPHASCVSFDSLAEAVEYVRSMPGPWVVKADGLAFGKGVTITDDPDEAERAIGDLLSGRAHGEAGRSLLIEDHLPGTELTAMVLTDGETVLPLPFARDHKRAFDGDKGPMTGGMGAFSPVDVGSLSGEVPAAVAESIRRDVVEHTLRGLKEEGIKFRGVIYAGLMLTKDGPKVLEYNVRFGDPETQCVVPLLEGDFAGALKACAEGRLAEFSESRRLAVRRGYCVSVVMASAGYPGAYRKGALIYGLEPGDAEEDGTVVFHSGTREEGGRLVTSGGRVLALSATGDSLSSAAERAYRRVGGIFFEGAHYRRDIAADAPGEGDGA